jgi:hypothetical protein
MMRSSTWFLPAALLSASFAFSGASCAKHADTGERSSPASTAPVPTGAAPAGATASQPDAAVVYALVAASKLSLAVTPPATLAQHYAQSIASLGAPTKMSCEPFNEDYACSIWFAEDPGFFYSVTLSTSESGWKIASAEVLSND